MRKVLTISTLALSMATCGAMRGSETAGAEIQGRSRRHASHDRSRDPDARIKAAEDLITKYADSEFKALGFVRRGVSISAERTITRRWSSMPSGRIDADPKHTPPC